MFRKSKLTMMALVLAAVAIQTTTVEAQTVAGRAPIMQINAKGYKICKKLKKANRPVWQAKIRGRQDIYDGIFTNRFVIRTCFKSKKQCRRFLANINRRVIGIEWIYYARCKSI